MSMSFAFSVPEDSYPRVKMKTNEEMNSAIQRVIERVDLGSDRRRNRRRGSERKRKQSNDAKKTRTRTITKMKIEKIQAREKTTNEIHETNQTFSTNG